MLNQIKKLPDELPKQRFIVSAIIVYIVYALFPLLQTGYFADDALNVTAKADANLQGLNVLQLTWNIWYHGWFKTMGRLFPLAFYAYSVFAVLKSLILYKLTTLAVIVFDILAFGCLIKILTKSTYLAYLLMLSIVTFFQFRYWYEPILSFHFMMPLVLLEVLISLLLFYKYLSSAKKRHLVASAFTYLLALLTYEISYALCVLHLIFALFYTQEQVWKDFKNRLFWALKQSSPFYLFSLAMIGLSYYFRQAVPFDKGGAYTINFDPMLYLNTFYIQVTGALPLVYYFANINTFKMYRLLSNLTAADFILAGMFGYFFYWLAVRVKELVSTRWLVFVGIALMVLPALLVSLSPKHQGTLFGTSYLQVYLQYFGSLSLLSAFVLFVAKFIKHAVWKKACLIALTVIVSLGSLINIACNRYIAEKMNDTGYYPMVVIEKALKKGILDNISEEATILTESQSAWDRRQYYYWLLNRKFNVVGLDQYLVDIYKQMQIPTMENSNARSNSSLVCDFRRKNVYVIKYYNYTRKDSGYVLFGKVDSVLFNGRSNKPRHLNVSALKLFVYGNGAYESIRAKESVVSESGVVHSNDVYHVISALPKIKSRRNYALYEVPIGRRAIDFNSIVFTTRDNEMESFPQTAAAINVRNSAGAKNPTNLPARVSLFDNRKNQFFDIRVSEDGRMYDFVTKKFITGQDYNTVQGLNGFAFAFQGGGESINLMPLNLKGKFTIEMLIYPAKTQRPFAVIIGNLPGSQNFRGFVVSQDGSPDPTSYFLSYGNGKSWLNTQMRFKLAPETWHYLTVVMDMTDRKKITIVDNGEIIAVAPTGESTLADSDMPVKIANWVNLDRPFNGNVEEVALTSDELGIADIKKKWSSIKKSFNLP